MIGGFFENNLRPTAAARPRQSSDRLPQVRGHRGHPASSASAPDRNAGHRKSELSNISSLPGQLYIIYFDHCGGRMY